MAAREVFYQVEYARTNRSTCNKSKKQIPEGALRIGRNSPSPFHDGYVTNVGLTLKKYCKDLKTVSQLKGYDSLRPTDKEKFLSLLGPPTNGSEASVQDDAWSAALWELKDYLNANSFLKELKANLEENGAVATGIQDTLATRVAEGMLFGRASCQTCAQKDQCQMTYSNQMFSCKAELQWGTCGYKGIDVEFSPWKYNDEFLSNHSHVMPKERLSRPLKKMEVKLDTYKRDSKKPLQGMTFCLAGKLSSSHKELEELITQNGGTYSDAIVSSVDFVVSTLAEVLAFRPKIVKANEFNLAIVTELLLTQLIKEFGFDHSPYLLAGKLPAISFAKLESSSQPSSKTETESKDAAAKKPTHELPVKNNRMKEIESKYPNGKVHKDDEATYDILMCQTDLNDGSNKYYILQIIDIGVGKSFVVFRKWGRVGTTVGGTAISEKMGFKSALDMFEEHYLDKSGNEWKDRNNFAKKPGKYFIIETDSTEEDESKKDEVQDSDTIPSFLPPQVYELVKFIFDVDNIKKDLQSLDIDVKKMPLGRLTQNQIKTGYDVLSKIEVLLNNPTMNQTSQLQALSSQYYTLIPTDFGNKIPPVINSFDLLHAKMRQMEALMDVQVTSTLMSDTLNVGMNPVDANYKKLGATLTPISEYSREFKMIKKYIENGYDPKVLGYKIKLDVVFAVSRPEEKINFDLFKHIRPRKMLWHGSRICNYVGILNQGLRIAPPEAPSSGYLFGKGIYFADRIQKSAPYCQPSKENSTGLLLLSDVALGEPYVLKKPEFIRTLPEGKNSTLVLSKTVPDPNKSDVGDDQVVIPSGPGVPSGVSDVFVEDQEYVIYQKQNQLKYLIKVKFLFDV